MNRIRRNLGVRAVRAGFTLVELLVVIVIIGLLATAVVTNYDRIFPAAKKARVATDLKGIEGAIKVYQTFNQGRLPESLERLVTKDDNGVSYFGSNTSVPRDPWGNEYVYRPASNGMTYELLSYGADGAPGGEGENADISLETLTEEQNKKK
jgi:general secretion pathway protein G